MKLFLSLGHKSKDVGIGVDKTWPTMHKNSATGTAITVTANVLNHVSLPA